MTYMSHHTLPLKRIKELQKSSCTLKLIELLGLTSLNGSFSREGTKPPRQSLFAFTLTFLQEKTETEAQNSRVMQLCEFVLGFESKHLILSSHYLAHPLHPTGHLCLYEGKIELYSRGMCPSVGLIYPSELR